MRKLSKIESRQDQVSIAILSMIVASQKPITLTALLRELRFRHGFVLESLHRLIEQGALARAGSGRRGSPFYYFPTSEFYRSTSKISQTISEISPKIAEELELIEVVI